MIRAILILATIALAMGGFLPAGRAQSVELKPIDRIDASHLLYSRSPYYSPTPDTVKDHVRTREEYRKSFWADEAGRIARAGQSENVVRDDDYLYIRDTSGNHAFAFRNIWGVDPAARYLYLAYDAAAHFHVIVEGGHDMPHLLLISARTGLVYTGFGMEEPIYSPDKKRFLSQGFAAMGCTGGVAIYSFDGNKPITEGVYSTGCDAPCSYEWLSPTEVKGLCREMGSLDDRVDYRLTYREGKWHEMRTQIAR